MKLTITDADTCAGLEALRSQLGLRSAAAVVRHLVAAALEVPAAAPPLEDVPPAVPASGGTRRPKGARIDLPPPPPGFTWREHYGEALYR